MPIPVGQNAARGRGSRAREIALNRERRARRGRADPAYGLYRDAEFAIGATDIDTDGVFGDRDQPITFATAIEITGASAAGIIFEFGDDTTGAKLAITGGDLVFAAGNSLDADDGGVDDSATIAALGVTGARLRVAAAINPGSGVVRVWVNGEAVIRAAAVTAFTSGIWSSANLGSFAAAHSGSASTQRGVVATVNGAPSDFKVTETLSAYIGQLPRQFA